MTGKGHQLFGIYTSMAAFPIALLHGLTGVALSAGILLGARAPDYLEIWTKSGPIIPHRTITHYVPLWLLITAISLSGLSMGPAVLANLPALPALPSELLLGFALSGLGHLVLDSPNPMGIPLLLPHKRISLNLWRSGEMEWLIHLASLAAIAYYYLFHF